VRRYLRDLDGCDADDVYEIVLREMEIPLFVEVLNHCEATRAAPPRCWASTATLRKKLKEYGISA
jgi:Fis family transcriptional regulator